MMPVVDRPQQETTKTLVICCNLYPPRFIGGAELIAHYQAKELQRLGWKVIVFTGDTKWQADRHDMSYEVYDGLEVFRVFLTHEDYHYEFVNFVHPTIEQHFALLLKQYDPTVVHFHNITGLSIRLITLAKSFGATTVLTLHDHWAFCLKNTLIKKEGQVCEDFTACSDCLSCIEDGSNRRIPIRLRQDFFAMTMRSVDAFVSPSAYLAKTYLDAGFPRDRMHIIWNGIDVARFRKIRRVPGSGTLRLSFFGYFGRHKGIRTLLDALPLIRDKDTVRVNLVGEGDQEGEYRTLLEKNGCGKMVRFWGKLDNDEIEDAYAETDVLILPSIWRENQPVSITEAMAAGIPVVASRVGGIPELVDDGRTGLLFTAGSSTELSDVINRLIDNPSLVACLGQTSARRMAVHDFADQVGKLTKVYQVAPRHNTGLTLNERLIVCYGRQYSLAAFEAIAAKQILSSSRSPRFVHAEWCDEWHWRSAWVHLVVDRQTTLGEVDSRVPPRRPLLVPESNVELRNFVRERSIGLFYRNADELLGCLRHLDEVDRDYRALRG